MKQKLFSLSAGALLLAGSVLAAGTTPHAPGRVAKPAARKTCPITPSCPASACQTGGKTANTCPPHPGCCVK